MNKSRYANNVSQLIDKPDGELRSLLATLNKIQTINNTLHSLLNATLAEHCRVANFRQSTLVLAADSAAWATKLRFQQADLLSKLRQSGYPSLANIEVIVQPR